MSRDVGLSGRYFRRLVEPVVGLADARAVVFVGGAVERIGPALGDHGNLPTRGSSLVGVAAGGSHAEFFDGVERRPQRSLEGIAVKLFVVIQAIERDVGLVATRAADR